MAAQGVNAQQSDMQSQLDKLDSLLTQFNQDVSVLGQTTNTGTSLPTTNKPTTATTTSNIRHSGLSPAQLASKKAYMAAKDAKAAASTGADPDAQAAQIEKDFAAKNAEIDAAAAADTAAWKKAHGYNERANNRISEKNDDDDDLEMGGVGTRQAVSRAQSAAWRQDAYDRSEAAIRKYPDFFTNDHLDRVDAIYDIIDRVLTPSKIFVTHRFGNGKPYTALSLYNTTWPSTFASRPVRDREFYNVIKKLGADPEPKSHKNKAPGFIIHVVK